MASTFKIPKRKQPAGEDATHVQSPLSRLQNSAADIQSSWGRSARGGADVMHAGNSAGGRQRACKPPFGRVVRTLLGLNSPGRVASSANHSADHHSANSAWNRQSQLGHRVRSEMAASCWSNGWRPKRASDRLLEPGVTSPWLPSTSTVDSYQLNKSICVQAVDSLAELRGKEHDGSLRNNPQRWAESSGKKQDSVESDRRSPEAPQKQLKKNSFAASSSDQNSDDDFVSPARTRNQTSADKNPQSAAGKPSSLSSPGSKVELKRTSWLAAAPRDDPAEKEREKWREFRDRKQTTGTASLHLRLRLRHKSTASEPIVLSSEEEDDAEKEGKSEVSRVNDSLLEDSTPKKMKVSSSRAETAENEPPLPPSFLQLDFDSLHLGLMNANANGKMMITENGITIPLKGAEEGEVSVVAPQVRGYGLWDGGVAQGGTLLARWEGPASSLLFLWVTEEQANVLHRELLAIMPPDTAVPPCSFLLLVLKEQLQELHAALLASILDMEGYIRGRASSSVSSPIDWTNGLLLFHSCPPPLDQHLLSLLGHSVEKPKHSRTSSRNKKSSAGAAALQQLPIRLIQYPAAPCKGRITVTPEDLACMDAGEFLNDVIIDFYLKYLLLEGVGGAVAERSHIFSSFFFKQLSRKRAAGEDDSTFVSDCHTRHQRVKTWTRHIDIFTKDFLFVPVNQASHWYLVVICFPGLEEVHHEVRRRQTGGGAERAAERPAVNLRPQQPPECTEQGCQRDSVMKRPCILVMDSLKLSSHENVCKLLRDYLQVEWEVRRGRPRLFTHSTMEKLNCRVPLQDNSSDCGLYLLQYVESFLQNPVVHFGFPVRLENWFPQQQVRKKREAIRSLILKMHHDQHEDDNMRPP